MKTKNLILLESFMKLKIHEAQSNLKKGETLDTDILAEAIFKGLKDTLNESSNVGKGSNVSWKYGTGKATGKVVSVHKDSVTRTIKGSEVSRKGSEENPAFVIEQSNGDRVLKLKSEVKPVAKLDEGDDMNMEEGIFDGLKNMFNKNSTMGKGATDTMQSARDLTNQGIDKVKQAGKAVSDKTKQVAGDIKTDYQVGSGAGEMKKIAANLSKLDSKFAAQKADLSQRWSAINKERAQFKNSYKAAKSQLQANLEPVYQALAQALKVDATQIGWMDKIDATLKQKNLAA